MMYVVMQTTVGVAFWSATLVMVTLSAQQSPPQQPQPAGVAPSVSRIVPPPSGHRFPNGVTYVYKAEWKLWDAGIATLRLDRDPSGMQRVTVTANSMGLLPAVSAPRGLLPALEFA